MMLEDARNAEIEKENMTLYMKMKAILLNSRESSRITANRKCDSVTMGVVQRYLLTLQRGLVQVTRRRGRFVLSL